MANHFHCSTQQITVKQVSNHGIQIKNLTKEFRSLFGKKRRLAVDNISLDVRKGEILGLLGPNGAGKTTLLKMICGLLKPTRGEIFINGKPLKKNLPESLSRLGAVLEGSRNSVWSMTVMQNLRYFGYLKNVHGQDLKNRSDMLLRFFDFEQKKNELVKNLSSGMRQKLAIILALINDPDLVLLDEPTIGLDVQSARQVKQRIVELAKNDNKTILLTTHQVNIVQEISDRVAIMNNGKLIAFEKTESILHRLGQECYAIKLSGRPAESVLNELPAAKDIELIQNKNINGEFTLQLALGQERSIFEVIKTLINARNIEILSINKSEPNLEDILVEMVKN